MTPLLSYLIKTTLIYLLCFIVYWVLFRKETFFFRNRIYLLICMIFPPIIPLIRFSTPSVLAGKISAQGIIRMISPAPIQSEPSHLPFFQQIGENNALPTPISWSSILIGLYLIGVLLFLARMILSYQNIIRLIIKSKRQPLSEMVLVITSRQVSPFSLFRWLVIPEHKQNHPDLDKIICHERIHYRQWHSIDLLLSEIMLAFQWFNPFAWMLKKSVVINNEFFVDHRLISVYTDVRSYQYALLTSSVGERRISIVNSFNQGLIKKRIAMMNKKETRLINRIKDLLVVPFAGMLLITFSAWTLKPVAIGSDSGQLAVKMETQDTSKLQQVAIHPLYIPDIIRKIEDNRTIQANKTICGKVADSTTMSKGSKNKCTVLTEGKIYSICLNDPKGKERLVVVNGKIEDYNDWIKPRSVLIKTICMLDPDESVKTYGAKAKYGAMVLTTGAIVPKANK